MSIRSRLHRWQSASREEKERDLDREIQSHLDLEAEESGARAARRAFGNITLVKEDVRATWGGNRLEQALRDVGYGLRQIRRHPGVSGIAMATLALGIGVNAAMYSAVDAVLLRPLPYADADRLVMVWDDARRTDSAKFFTTPPEWSQWRRLNTVFTDIAATQPGDAVLSGDGDPEELPARKVTANFWTVLGVQPLAGRVFTDEEDSGGVKVVVISYGLWQRRFAGSPQIVGRTISLNDQPFEVIGVMPRGFYFMPSRDIDVWMPTSFSSGMLRNWGWHDVQCVARLKPGVTLQQANEQMAALNLRVSGEHVKPARSAVVTALRGELAGKAQTSLIVLLCGSLAVLLIACVNLANLLLSRGAVRRREVAVRVALGASRGRLIQQFLTESLVLAALGAAAGLAVARPVMRFLETLVPETMAGVHLSLDWRVLAFSGGIAIISGLFFGVAPAVDGSRVALLNGLRDGGRGTAGARSYRFQHSLIVAETALAVVLLTSGGLLLQTFRHLQQLDLGIRREKLLTFVTPLFRYPDFEKRVAFVNAELDKVRALPGVVSVAAISRIPLTVTDQATFYKLEGQSNDDAREQVARTRVVTRGYFETVGARLREGRSFGVSDRRSDHPVAIVNESFANRHFPGRSPIGARFQFGRWGDSAYWYTIVGVVKEIRDGGVAADLRPTVYRVHEQADQTGDKPSGIVVRTSVDPKSIVPVVRSAIWSVDRNQPIARVQTIEDIVDRQLSGATQSTTLLGAFALLALLLASIGLYGVLSNAVVQRTNEIGVRMALGATRKQILLVFGTRGLLLTLVGLAMGIVVAAGAARLMSTLFYGRQPSYVPTIIMVSMILLAVAALACFVPARRASLIDPMLALQQE